MSKYTDRYVLICDKSDKDSLNKLFDGLIKFEVPLMDEITNELTHYVSNTPADEYLISKIEEAIQMFPKLKFESQKIKDLKDSVIKTEESIKRLNLPLRRITENDKI